MHDVLVVLGVIAALGAWVLFGPGWIFDLLKRMFRQ